jgi:hemerythrin-like metal-binding protein
MARLTWNDQLQLGVPEIDRQHQRLVEQLTELTQGIREHRPAHALRHVLAELISYSRYHFNAEENLMRTRGWSGLDEHAALHRLFIGRVDLFQQLLGRETPEEVALKSARFLAAWIVRHIAIADRLAWSSMRHQGLV